MNDLTGLAGRNVIPLPGHVRADLERRAQLHHDNPTARRVFCMPCLKLTWRTHAAAACTHCCKHTLIPGYLRKANGHVVAQRQCLDCGRRWDLRRTDPASVLDVCLRDNTTGRYAAPPCERCGTTTGTELHHWAPVAIFNDAEQWPKSWLCPTCHRIWHNAIRAAAGVSLPPDQRVGTHPWADAS